MVPRPFLPAWVVLAAGLLRATGWCLSLGPSHPRAAPPSAHRSLARVQRILELGAGVPHVEALLVDGVIGAKLDDYGVTCRVDLLWRLKKVGTE